MVDVVVFIIAAAIILASAIGVVISRNPVRAAMSLVASFFGVAVLFVLQEAHFLALVQVVVYAGAIVVLFLFVIMLLGVDTTEDLSVEPISGQRVLAGLAGLGVFALILVGFFASGGTSGDSKVAITGQHSCVVKMYPRVVSQEEAGFQIPVDHICPGYDDFSVVDAKEVDPSKIHGLARDLFSRNLVALEATALLLTIATIGAVVMVKDHRGTESEGHAANY